MKFSISILIYLLFLVAFDINIKAQGTGFVTLNGRQFYDEEGNPFYPMVMNYGVRIARTVHNNPGYAYTLNDLHISPEYNYGDCYNFDVPDADGSFDTQIKNELRKCKLMGFNCIRLVGTSCPEYLTNNFYKYGESNPQNARIVVTDAIGNQFNGSYTGFAFRVIDYNVFPPAWVDRHMSMTPNITTNNLVETYTFHDGDPNTKKFVDLLDHFLDIVDEMNSSTKEKLHVILLAGGPQWNDQNAINAYTAYLEYLAQRLKNHTSLIAYDLYNEPEYQIHLSAHTPLTAGGVLKKNQVCEMTTDWYDVIKANDPNHYVTLGTGAMGGQFIWDASVTKLDFVSPHFYPYEMDYEIVGDNAGYSRVEAYERYQGQVYWTSRNSIHPWLIGETGLAGQDNIGGKYDVPPYIMGSENEQKIFARNTQQYVWDCGGSGYSWWNYQAGVPQPPTAEDIKNGIKNPGDYYSLRYHCQTADFIHPYTDEKSAVDEFRAPNQPYLQNRNTPSSPPPAFYDPYHHFNYSQANAVQGKVEYYDVNGNLQSIAGAIVAARTFKRWVNLKNKGKEMPEDHIYYTFTGDGFDGTVKGEFTLIPFDPSEPNNLSKQYVRHLYVTGAGASVEENNWWGNFGYDSNPQNWYIPAITCSTNCNFILKKISNEDDETTDNKTVVNGEVYVADALKKLTVSLGNGSPGVDVHSGGIAEFFALNEVHLLPGFDAISGSEVHVYNAPVNIDCEEMDNTHKNFRLAKELINEEQVNERNLMELQFKKVIRTSSMSVYPNPGSGIFAVFYEGNLQFQKEVILYDLLGKKLVSTIFTGSNLLLDLNDYPKGVYFVQLRDNINTFNQKLIIQ